MLIFFSIALVLFCSFFLVVFLHISDLFNGQYLVRRDTNEHPCVDDCQQQRPPSRESARSYRSPLQLHQRSGAHQPQKCDVSRPIAQGRPRHERPVRMADTTHIVLEKKSSRYQGRAISLDSGRPEIVTPCPRSERNKRESQTSKLCDHVVEEGTAGF